jgi:hypothetical protein
MAKETKPANELVDTHKPKNVKFKYIFTDDTLLDELLKMHYDVSTLDTIENDALVNAALEAQFREYERTIVGKSNEPVFIEDGICVSKKLVTKADKKLQHIAIGFFVHDDAHYMAIKLVYERFAILEIFSLIKYKTI